MHSLRILQLATSTGGGAGIAARRTHEALLENNSDSTLITLTDYAKANKVFEIKRSRMDKLKSSALTAFQSYFFQSSDQLLTAVSRNSFKEQGVDISSYQVIHIHAYYNLLSTRQIIDLCQNHPEKRFFITLHDERFLTGGCHYSQGCPNILSGCKRCPQATPLGGLYVGHDYTIKLKGLSSLGNLQLISPSRWLKELARVSPATQNLVCHVVRNPVPKVFFETKPPLSAAFPMRIAFVSAHLGTRMKGLTTLVGALNLIAAKGFSDSFELVLVGQGEVPEFLDTRIKIENLLSGTDEETAKILGTCQILALPSIQDNLPSTMTEALCSGLSVVGTKIGGINEILTAYNQVSVEPEDPHAFAEALLSLRTHQSTPLRSQALSEFSYAAVAVRLLLIYNGE